MKTKVLHALESSLPKLAGYTIRSKYIIDNQRREGFTPVVITSPIHGKTHQSYRVPEVIDDVRYYRTGQFNRLDTGNRLVNRLVQRYRYSRGYLEALKWVADREEAAIIHAHSSYLNGVRATQAAKAVGVPSVYEVRGLWQDTAATTVNIGRTHWKYRFIEYMDMKAMRSADRVVAISAQLKNELSQKGIDPDKIFIVPNGVDTDIFKPTKKKAALIDKYQLSDSIVLGFIGSIRRLEGLDMVVENFPKLLEKHANIHLLIVGGGDAELERLKQLARKPECQGKITFPGRVPHDEVLDYYSLIDVFLYPRIDAKVNQKVTPLKPLEAMAMEKVVVASDVGGLKELVQDETTGLLFRVGDSDHLTQRCCEAIESDELRRRIGRQARQWTVKDRDWGKVIKRYSVLYDELMRRKAGRPVNDSRST